MRVAVVVVVVNALRLVQQDLFPVCIHTRKQSFLFQGQIVDVKIPIFDEENIGSLTLRSMSFPLQFEYTHSVVVASGEVVQSRVSSDDPIPVCISPRLMKLYSSIQVPQSQSFILGIREENF